MVHGTCLAQNIGIVRDCYMVEAGELLQGLLLGILGHVILLDVLQGVDGLV